MPGKYFDYGVKTDNSHYALYQPVFDCFLLTLSDSQQAQEIKTLVSGRYDLFLIDLCRAKNYFPTLIDNSCCENWTIQDRMLVDIGKNIQSKDAVIPADQLVPANPRYDPTQEKQWLQFLWHWAKLITEVNQRSAWDDQFIHTVMEKQFFISPFTEAKSLLCKVQRILYLSNDMDTSESAIHTVMDQTNLGKFYNEWKKNHLHQS